MNAHQSKEYDMGYAQRQEQHDEQRYGNGEPGNSRANAAQRDALRLEDLLDDVFEFVLADRATH
ncbi:hypothetical protein GHT07_17860 [Caenimonas koreensis DSM 17982]|uniref:Uncharacterized protein n=2 Tax=Caenimonas TaxID=763439 RepID=A0A844AXP7_9BURK|nr:hypothetical protein [Caenimonas koreensis]MRD49145.1 hypothetical protein [Caenimonas koreensis DSM 17982]